MWKQFFGSRMAQRSVLYFWFSDQNLIFFVTLHEIFPHSSGFLSISHKIKCILRTYELFFQTHDWRLLRENEEVVEYQTRERKRKFSNNIFCKSKLRNVVALENVRECFAISLTLRIYDSKTFWALNIWWLLLCTQIPNERLRMKIWKAFSAFSPRSSEDFWGKNFIKIL